MKFVVGSRVVWGAALLVGSCASPVLAADQVIRACANPAGQLRIIGAGDSCRPQETLVTWNAAGAPGAVGQCPSP